MIGYFDRLSGLARFAVVFAALVATSGAWPAELTGEESVAIGHGVVHYSDGARHEGRIRTTSGQSMEFHDDSGRKHMLKLEDILEMTFYPSSREMERKWFFPEAGKTHKQEYGEPYPVMHIRANVRLRDGAALSGQLYSTVLLVRPDKGRDERVVIKSKIRGKEGQSFAELRYPEQVVLPAARAVGGGDGKTTAVVIPEGYRGEGLDVAALCLPELLRIDAEVKGESMWLADGGRGCVVAMERGGKVGVVWPWGQEAAGGGLHSKIVESVEGMKDFFDVRKVLAVSRAQGGTVYSLVFMNRVRATTMDGKQTNPWQLIVQRWKHDDSGDAVMLAGKGWLLRGIRGRAEVSGEFEIEILPLNGAGATGDSDGHATGVKD